MSAKSPIQIHRPAALLQAELAIAYVLRGGVLISGAVIALGLALRIFHLSPVRLDTGGILADLSAGKVSDGVNVPHSVPAFVDGIRHLDPDVIMSLGLLLLIALPIVRVGMTILLFLIERDWIYFAITALVFAILIFGVLYGKAL